MKYKALILVWVCFAFFACKRETCSSTNRSSVKNLQVEESLVYHDLSRNTGDDISVILENHHEPVRNTPALSQITLLSQKYFNNGETLQRYQPGMIQRISSSDQVRFSLKSGDEITYIENGQVFYSYRSDSMKIPDSKK